MAKREIIVVLTPLDAQRRAEARARAQAEARKAADARGKQIAIEQARAHVQAKRMAEVKARSKSIASALAEKLSKETTGSTAPAGRRKGGILGLGAFSPRTASPERADTTRAKLTDEAKWIKDFGFD